MEKEILTFGKDKSEILRGIAVMLMVVNHSLPGRVISFAVPLFSFLVGYGYGFARERSLRYGVKRVWHLLANFWLVLLGICLPVALYNAPQKVQMPDLILNMFGLDPTLNFFCWYIYFYIFTMAVMPAVSRFVDKYGLKGAIFLSLLCGGGVLGITFIDNYGTIKPVAVIYRCLRYLPIVIGGYWLSASKFYSRISYSSKWWMGLCALAAMVGVYFLRGIPYSKVIDLIWAPLFAAALAIFFGVWKLKPVAWLLGLFGKNSMHIWFLHALFFTHATKRVFYPLIKWTHINSLRIAIIFGVSLLLAIGISWLYPRLSALCANTRDYISRAISARRRPDFD